ncbi:uncharacterized protein [Setaria viridis]|uniref:uncharacterized protein isoform X2 n=1 Tax=Setaria viridis TaxID=4556 RepID=UPI001493817C|nr:pre-mRNA-splicing factor cwc21-like isoform X2 [Setaria viridis]
MICGARPFSSVRFPPRRIILLPACHPPPPLPLLVSFSCVTIRHCHSLRRAASRHRRHSLHREPPSPAPAVTPYVASTCRQPRGSGTSGHVRASKFLAKPRPSSSAAAAASGYGTPNPPHIGSSLERTRKPNKDILEHDRKRQVELRLLVLRDALEEQEYTEAQIEDSVGEARKAAENKAAAEEGSQTLRATKPRHRRRTSFRL